MGKRKERRLAAKNVANRRMKLDLCAEPSEDKMPDSFNVEVGENQEADHCASAPSSPSSSGGFHESLFKGLYREDISAQHIFGGNLEILQKRFVAKLLGDFRTNCGQNKENPLLLLGQYSDDELDEESNELLIDSDDLEHSPGNNNKETDHAVASEDGGSGKDEIIESETYDQHPDLTVSTIELNHNDDNAIENNLIDPEHCKTELASLTDPSEEVENEANGHANEHWKLVLHEESNRYYYWNTVTGETSWEVPGELAVNAQISDEPSVQAANKEKVADGFHLSIGTDIDARFYGQVCSTIGHESSNFVPEDPTGYENIEAKHENISDISKKDEHYCFDTATYSGISLHSSFSDPENFQASQLVQYGEILLHKLNTLYRSEHRIEECESIQKEIDIRLSDCRALSQYGSSLLPFWWHTEAQLKRIESIIVKSECSNEPSQKNSHSERNEDYKVMVVHEPGSDIASIKHEEIVHEPGSDIASINHEEIVPQVDLAVDCSFSVPLFDNGEDDMDVEMEVDEDDSSESPSNQPIQTNPTSSSSLLPNESIVPPPLEEWIPPPPPDADPPLPPPLPPDSEPDPLEPSPTSMYTYPDQYSAGCVMPAYDYYSSTVTDTSNGNYYGLPGCSQLSESEQPIYYEPLPATTLPELLSSGAAVGPAAYLEPSAFYVESRAVSYHDVPVDVPVSKDSQLGNLQVLYGLPSAQSLGGSSGNDGSLHTQTPSVSKNQSKVERSKKRAIAPTLRSNKKVSSLVDKWNAAKEELHSDEEEPENPLENLEKKRQKEIAEWRARQVATGEAQDNANFVPLGGDWRDRVKRRRNAEARAEYAQAAAKQPDITEISKNLPSGWQAYWDNSTKQVYYGNQTTSETTWEKPTR